MQEKSPLVSICIPTYNGENFLLETLLSINIQTYSEIEIIISDDNSSDNTLQIIRNFAKTTQFPVKILDHKPIGIGANWNNCITYSSGEYIKFVFQDDLLEKDCIKKMVALAVLNKKIGFVYCKRRFVCEDKTYFKSWLDRFENLHTHWKSLTIKTGWISGKKYLKDGNFLSEPLNKIGEPTAVLIKRECFEKYGLFRTDLKQVLDFEFWYRIMPYYDIGFIDEPLISFRLHKNQASVSNSNSQIQDYVLLPKIYYAELIKYLSLKNRIKLLRDHNKITNFIFKILKFTKFDHHEKQ